MLQIWPSEGALAELGREGRHIPTDGFTLLEEHLSHIKGCLSKSGSGDKNTRHQCLYTVVQGEKKLNFRSSPLPEQGINHSLVITIFCVNNLSLLIQHVLDHIQAAWNLNCTQ